jgi:phospholipid transport system substrate-binding protein
MIARKTVSKKTRVSAVLLASAVATFAASPAVYAADAPASATSSEASTQLGPAELVAKVAQDTLKDLDAHRSEYKNNSKKLRELVDKNLLPYFDTSYAGQLVLGKYWRDATPDQRKRFVDAFYQSLLQTYGEALTDFTPDRLKIMPFLGNPQDTIATVRSEVRRDDGSKVPVNYSLHKTPQGWKAYDVQISGVSYVKSMRTDFGSEVQQKGLDAVIQRLESQVASGQPAAPKAAESAKK